VNIFSASGSLATFFPFLFLCGGVTELASESLMFSVLPFPPVRFELDLRRECRRALMRVDFSDRFDRAVLVVVVEVLLRTEWKENFLGGDDDDGVVSCEKVGLAGVIGSYVV
jgi:hypothetical protein